MERQTTLESLGVKASIGSLEDADFLSKSFSGADVVYSMQSPICFFDHNSDVDIFWTSIANKFVKAIQNAGVVKVIHFSSIGDGGNTDQGNPLITVIFFLFRNLIIKIPPSLRTLLLTFVAVPLMFYVILTFYNKLFLIG